MVEIEEKDVEIEFDMRGKGDHTQVLWNAMGARDHPLHTITHLNLAKALASSHTAGGYVSAYDTILLHASRVF